MTEKEKEERVEISRREFLKDAGLVVGGAAIGSTVLLASCGGEGETVTATKTVTTTKQVGEVTKTVTQTVSKFVCPLCNQEFGTLAALQAHFTTTHPEAPVAALNVVTLTVNGQQYEIQVQPEWSLLDVLRKKLLLTGTKVVCKEGACGACTVLSDDRPVLSCMMLAIECDGKQIDTIEGLAKSTTELHPIQEAFIENFGFGCGFCTPGMIMSTKALLDNNTNPTDQDVRQALSGNLCRCTGYVKIVESVLAAAKKLGGG